MTASAAERAYAAMQSIRSFLGNDGYRRHGLQYFDHTSACAAADACDDADLAIEAYSSGKAALDVGEKYLALYGVLQAAYLQGNALKRLHSVCGLGTLEFPLGMAKLREIRNAGVAHPAPAPPARESRKPISATFIGRYSVEAGTLSLQRYDSAGDFSVENVNLVDAVSVHREEAASVLENIRDDLAQREHLVRELIRAQGRVSQLLAPSWTYLTTKIKEASHEFDLTRASFAAVGVPELTQMLEGVRLGLQRLDLPPIHSWHFDMAHGGLSRLAELLSPDSYSDRALIDIAAHAELVDRHFSHIAKALEEHDERLG